MLIRKPKRNRAPVKPVNPHPGVVTIPVPIGLLKTIVERCEATVWYGDKKAEKAFHARADAADFYRRAAEIALEELNKLINKGE